MFISVNDHHKAEAVKWRAASPNSGFELVATRGTAAALRAAGLACKMVFKVNEGRPNAVDLLKGGSDPAGHLHHHGRAGVSTTRRRSAGAR